LAQQSKQDDYALLKAADYLCSSIGLNSKIWDVLAEAVFDMPSQGLQNILRHS